MPLLDGENPTSTSPTLFEDLPAEGDGPSESELTGERFEGVFSTSTEDCYSSEMQRHPTPCCPPLSSDIQLNNTVQELQYGSQTNEEKGPSTSQSQPAKEAGIVDIKGTQEKISFTLEIQPEVGVEEYTSENVISQPPRSFQTSTTASQASVEVQDKADRAIEVELLSKTVTEQNSQSQTLCTPLFHRNESKQIYMPQTEISHTEPAPETEALNVPNFQAQGGDQGHRSMSPDTTATDQSESFCIQDTFSKPSSAPLLVGTDPVVSLQTEQGTCPSEQVTSTEMPLIAQIVHSSGTHEIVVVREDGDWSGVHLNQSYLLQREDGTVCQAAIINNLGSELSAGQTVHLDSQSVEVYQFCDLVEEVAEETVCGSSGIQIPHSPGYEVNLFNALLDNSDDFSLKEDLESQMDTTFHTIDESGGVIISQQAVLSSHDGNQIVTCTSSDCHTMSIQNTAVAAVQQHLILNARQSVANANEVCLVEVANVTPDSFAVEQANTSTEALEFSTQIEMATCQSEAPQKQETDLTVSSPTSPLQVVSGAVHVDRQPSLKSSPDVTVSATKPEPCVSSNEEAKEPPTSVAPLQTIHTVVVTTSTATTSPSPFLGKINPQLLILKPGTHPVLKPPAPLVAQVSMGQNAHSSGTQSEECLSHTISAADLKISSVTPCSQNEQTTCSVKAYVKASVPSLPTLPDSSLTSKSEPLLQNLNGNISGSQNSAEVPVLVFETSQMDSTALSETSFTDPLAGEDEGEEDEDEGEEGEGEEDGEDGDEEMEQDEPLEDAVDGSVDEGSSDEEGSNGEAEADRHEGEETSPASPPHKVRQWIANRVSINSSPGSPSPGPSSCSDWSTPPLDRSSPLRGSHGKFVSPQDQSTPHRPRGERHSDMAEQAKHEADIENRTQALKREGFWSMKRLTRLTEPPRPKVHWEYLCEEMQWLSADFAQERRWKRGVARKVVRMVMRHHEELRQKEEKAKRDEQSKIRKVAASIAKEVRAFWSSVEKVVQYKQQSRLDEKRKKALDLQLDFIVGQTEKYSDLLSQSLAPTSKPDSETDAASPQKSQPTPVDEDDGDFEPQCEEEDDEETIEVEEQQDGNDAESHRIEIELLKEEGTLPLDQLLSTLNLPQDGGSEAVGSDQSSSSAEEDEDREFTANEEDAEDEEDTIAAQEKVEGNVDHSAELDELAKEGDMSLEELLEKYKGAYASDIEEPSASASKASSDTEVSGDEEEETEEDESDVESHTSSSESPGDSEDEESAKEGSAEDASGDEGMEILLKEGDHSPTSSSSRPKKDMSHIAATAESLQPKGYTLATTKVKTPIPFLLHGTLREYQHIGLDWLVTMFEKKLNGILADEMGLGKTIQTIALLAHLACEKSNWGPHLIIVPTSVMLNWEMELKRWCPGFKILTYFGSQKERKLKRQGWTKPNAFHVCITSYKLVLQDHQAFRRKSWRYLILDEAQNIKNFKSQRWQSLLNFNSHRRLLLTGTPLQNSLMELWSLMHFLMPHVFQSHREFKEWFSNPLTGMIEGSQEYNEGLIKRLHKVLRPFLLRRIKADVEKQMPKKYEHVVRCRLSKRQRFLYDDFMSQASTRETLASGHFMSVINILMQLRKVCNHPNLFDPRPIQSPFITKPIVFRTASLVHEALEVSPFKRCDLSIFDLIGLEARVSRYQADVFMPKHTVNRQLIQEIVDSPESPPRPKSIKMKVNRMVQPPKVDGRSVVNKPNSPVPPAPQPPKPPPLAEATPVSTAPSSAPAPAVQQVVCSVAPTPAPRPTVHPQTAVRSSTPKTVLTVRPPITPGTQGIPVHPSPSSVMPQRVLLSPDMQARLPSGEVVSIAQLASLAGRPVSSCQGSKPVTFQLQGNKLTLSGAQIATPRPVQGNVMHLAVTSGGQHHLISQPAQVTVQTTSNTHPVNSPASASIVNRLPPNASSQVPSSVVSSSGVVKIVVRQSAGKDGGSVPTLAVAPSPRVFPQPVPVQYPSSTPVRSTPIARHTAPIQIAHRTPGPATAHYTIAPPPRIPSAIPSQSQPPRPILKVVQPPPTTTPTTPVQPAPAKAAPTPAAPKAPAPQPSDKSSNNNQTANPPKSKPVAATKASPQPRKVPHPPPHSPFYLPSLAESQKQQRESKLDLIMQVNDRRCGAKPVYGREVLDFLNFLSVPAVSPAPLGSQPHWGRSGHSSCLHAQSKDNFWFQSRAVREGIYSIEERLQELKHIIDRFTFVIPSVECPTISMHCCHPPPSQTHQQTVFASMLSAEVAPRIRSLHRIQANMRTQFPDLRLIQYDCGKLQILHKLLRELKTGSHRVLIFTQMTRMLDVLEQFLNYHGHIYLRLDGSTRVEQRQALMERFNADRRIFCFILSTRSGGVGVNLTGADTVIFYDSDWNPTMDAQAQDRCHRIGQTRDVHIYRLISERTVEENILKKANQKRMLGDMAIEGGNFTTAFFKEQTIRELFDVNDGEKREAAVELTLPPAEEEETSNKPSTNILEQALCRAEDEEDIVAASQAKAEQVAELAEFNENIPLDDGGENEEVEEMSKAEQEIAALVEQLTPIERYAMNFLEASLEDVCKEELKQAEEQVEAARKGLDQAKEGCLKLHPSSDDDEDDFLTTSTSAEHAPTPARRGRKPKEKVVASTRTSGRLRGASPEMESEPTTPREVPRSGRGRPPKDPGTAIPVRPDQHKTRSQDSKTPKAASPAREQPTVKTRSHPNRSPPSQVPSPPTVSPPKKQQQQSATEAEGKVSKSVKSESEGGHEKERPMSESSLESSGAADNPTKDDENKDQIAMSPPTSCSRSPRKRVTADDEILKGLNEDSPSAKVLRKLPGRLVTVVEEKEPRKRKRRTSGTGGSSEETNTEEHNENPPNNGKDKVTPSPECKMKDTAEKPKEPESPILPPVRSYPPYSPPHLSPDMPVLRNLPVRRRVETENRMAAQMGELFGRGRGSGQHRKTDTTQGKDSSQEANSTPAKRRRGRPPKSFPDNAEPPSPQPTSPTETSNPPLSPKRKRGRNSKDSSVDTESAEPSKTDVTRPKTDGEQTVPDKFENSVDASVSAGQNETAKDGKSDTNTEMVSSNSSQAVASKSSEGDKITDSEPTPPTDQEIAPSTPAPTVVTPTTESPEQDKANDMETNQIANPPSITTPTSTPIANPGATTTNTSHTSAATESSADLPKVETSAPASTVAPQSSVSSMDSNVKMVSTTAATGTVEMDTTNETIDSPQETTSQSTSIVPTTSSSTTTNTTPSTSKAPEVDISLLTPSTTIETETFITVPSYTATTTASTSQTDKALDKSVLNLSNTTQSVPAVSTPKEKDVASEEKTVSVAIPTEQPIKSLLTTSPAPIAITFTTTTTTSANISTTLTATTSTTSLPVNAISSTTAVPTSLKLDPLMTKIQSPLLIPSAEIKEKDNIPKEQVAIVSSVEREKMPEQQLVKTVSTSEVTDMEVEQEQKQEICAPEVNRKKAETSSEAEETDKEVDVKICNQKDDKQRVMDELVAVPKRVLSRQSSQDSTRSSSPSSGCSTHTLTRHAHHKKTYENRNPAKRRRVDVLAPEPKTEEKEVEEGDKETKEKRQDEKQLEESQTEDKAPAQRRRSRSSSSSSDSDTDSKKEHRLTRSAKRRLQDRDGEGNRQAKKPTRDRNSVNASTGGESGSDASSARSSRKSTDTKAPPAPPPEPEVLGKRCSALNAAAKLLAMKGSVDTPGHTPRRDSAARANAIKEKNEKAKSKAATSSPPTNSVAKNATNKNSEKETASKPPNQSSRTPTRSTRQCPGSLVPPLETEYKKPKAEEKDSRKSSGGKEGEREARRSSRGNSACSSISSDEGEGSRSSSNSSQRTHSISSQNAGRCGSRSRATSSGSERDRSSERSKNRDKKDKRDRRESRRDGRRSSKLQNDVTSSSGAEGTPDRVLRSVAALAAAQARSPAASTRSSASQNRNKT